MPLLLELLKAPAKLPEFALAGLLFAFAQGMQGRATVAAKLLEHGCGKCLFGAMIRQNGSFYQDRLGTNIRKETLNKRGVFFRREDTEVMDVLMSFLREPSPSSLFATAGFSRQPHGAIVWCVCELVQSAQAAGEYTSFFFCASFCAKNRIFRQARNKHREH